MTDIKIPKPPAIGKAEREQRLNALRAAMKTAGVPAVLLGPTTSLRYFTGTSWHPSERFTGAIVHADGGLEYVCPQFEREKVAGIVGIPGEINTWEEDESPFALIADRIGSAGPIALDDQVQHFFYLGLRGAIGDQRIANAGPLINKIRRCKSPTEIALMQYAKNLTLEVHKRAWQSLKAGVMASEVEAFIDRQHRELGADGGNTFCIVAFAEDSALPHGPDKDRALKDGDVVLIDTGCAISGYNSDITRTYVFGEPTQKMREVWQHEKEAQAAAFAAAKLGDPCENVDAAVRTYIASKGYGPDYRMPGVGHRTGHGIGLDIHESPNLVRGEKMPLEVGMCFSNEPMIVIPGEFGIRLEDHFHMTGSGAKWFTQPQHSLDEPFKDVPAFA
jgi:Xaa-Pro dipeptidase